MNKRLRELENKDNKNRNRLIAATSALFYNTSSNDNLYSNLGGISKEVRSTIKEIKDEAKELAVDDVEEFDGSSKVLKDNKVRTAAVSMSAVAAIVVSIQMHLDEDEDYSSALRSALAENEAKLELIASTEFFNAYNAQYLYSLRGSKGHWEWEASLDKRTCSQCSGLHGKQWENPSDVPSIPAHPRCRCVLNFYPE